MPRASRLLFAGGIYHAMTRGFGRQPIFADDEDRNAWLRFMLQAKVRHECVYLAYCLMTNHVHLAIETPKEGNLDSVMEWIKGRYADYFDEKHGASGPLYEGRYVSKLVDRDEYLLGLIRYIHRNPVKAGMTDRSEDYDWSSRKSFVSTTFDPLCSPGLALGLLSADVGRARLAYVDFENRPIPAEEWKRFDSRRNGIVGSRAFRAKIRSMWASAPKKVPAGTF